MASNSPQMISPQVIDTTRKPSSKKRAEMRGGDFSPDFHATTIRTFRETSFNIKETAKQMKIPARVVNEILHARDFIAPRPVASAFIPRLVRRVA